jgi:hypothetical protein
MKILLLLTFFSFSAMAISLEGRFIDKNDKCSILINEIQLSTKYLLPVKCEMFLVDKYKYKFEIDEKSCPYKVKKVGIIAPGLDTKTFNISDLSNKCSIKK